MQLSKCPALYRVYLAAGIRSDFICNSCCICLDGTIEIDVRTAKKKRANNDDAKGARGAEEPRGKQRCDAGALTGI